MGRPLLHIAPLDGEATHACNQCGTGSLAASDFYWYTNGSRYPVCKVCHGARTAHAAIGYSDKICEICGAEYAPTSGKQAFCSEPCMVTARRMAARERYRAEHPLAPRECRDCGKEFEPVDGAQRFCSNYCLQSYHGGLSRARKAKAETVPFARAYIIERDRSRCHLCGKRCEPDEIHLDHLVPLSLGGAHAPENVRVACAACNLSKKASARGEQLLLIG